MTGTSHNALFTFKNGMEKAGFAHWKKFKSRKGQHTPSVEKLKVMDTVFACQAQKAEQSHQL